MKKHAFDIIKVLRNDNGVVAKISKKEFRNGYTVYSFSLYKEFERKPGAPTQETAWMNERHIASIPALLDDVRSFIRSARDEDYAAKRQGHG